jgi:(p)ppGpp synthase/HD superfamily hydrolase
MEHAIARAATAHAGTTDKAGAPYILHLRERGLLRVARYRRAPELIRSLPAPRQA